MPASNTRHAVTRALALARGPLADGRFHSGVELAQALGCSRSAVWHDIRTLESLGLAVDALPRRGYRLKRPFDPIRLDVIATWLAEANCPFALAFLDQTDSTNTHLLQCARQGAQAPLALLCEHQRAGRGRLGRRWQSELGCGLTLSALWRFERPATDIAASTPAVGVSLIRSLTRLGVDGVGLKWPNDLIVLKNDAKLGGILIEIQGDVLGPCAAVIGIGLNVRPQTLDLPDRDYADLSALASTPLNRNAVAAQILIDLHQTLTRFERDGLTPFVDAWNAHHAWAAQPVDVILPSGKTRRGRCQGIDDAGALSIACPDGDLRLVSGDLHRIPESLDTFDL